MTYPDDTPLTHAMFNELCNYFDPAPVAHLCAYDRPGWWLGGSIADATLEFEPYSYEWEPGDWVESTRRWHVHGDDLPDCLIPKTYGDFMLLCKLLKVTPRNQQ